MTHIHIHAPSATAKAIQRTVCQDCELTLQNITVVEIGTEDKP